MSTDIKLSIFLTTYNHELYIRQCLESVLKQKANFSYEIVLGDDASTDRTVEIIEQVMQEYPGKIRLFANKVNIGASRNIYNLLQQTRGKYITYLEGDDYWEITDEFQKSIDFLEHNSEYIGIGRLNKNFSERQQRIMSVARRSIATGKTVTYKKWKKCKGAGICIYRNFYKEEKTNGNFSIIYRAAPMAAEIPLGFLLAIRGNVYATNKAWEIKRYDRIRGVSNYNSITAPLNIALEQVDAWNVISEEYPKYDLDYRKCKSMNNLYFACKRLKRMDVYYDRLQLCTPKLKHKIRIKIFLGLYVFRIIKKPFSVFLGKYKCIMRKIRNY